MLFLCIDFFLRVYGFFLSFFFFFFLDYFDDYHSGLFLDIIQLIYFQLVFNNF